MADTFGSVREALGYYYAARKGPGWSKMRYSDAPRSPPKSPSTWTLVGSLLHGPEPDLCGVDPGSTLDKHLEAWARGTLDTRTRPCKKIEDKMRRLMKNAGLLVGYDKPTCDQAEANFRYWKDENGRRWLMSADRDSREDIIDVIKRKVVK